MAYFKAPLVNGRGRFGYCWANTTFVMSGRFESSHFVSHFGSAAFAGSACIDYLNKFVRRLWLSHTFLKG